MQLLKRTSQSEVRERGVHGQSVLELHQQLAGIIARRTGNGDVAAFLARPSRNQATGEILWYTPLEGPVRGWTELSGDERAAAQARAGEALGAITGAAGAADADILAAALGHDPATGTCRYTPASLFLVGGIPVLADWGTEATNGATERVSLTNTVAAPPPPSPPPPPPQPEMPVAAAATVPAAERRGWPRWLWILLALALLLLLLSALLRGCAPLGMAGAPATPGAIAPAALAEEEALRREIETLGRDLEQRAAQCVAEAPPAPEPAPEPVPEPAPEPAPEPEPEPEPPAEAVPDDEAQRLEREEVDVGEVNVSLVWNNLNDLDLAVIEPSGERIHYNQRSSRSGGRLDVDMNAERLSRQPIENISWASGSAPRGTYTVLVAQYEAREQRVRRTPFRVTVTVMGRRTVYDGVIDANEPRRWIPLTEFTVP
ncbi:hypothetical protein ACM64Y_19885 [Novispirillum sp. DQ9]|uniref:hypothetical protein n=1 Tax=Novispirillum sp. DQ9 TaxID=3398612 RepID=UPI003C7C9D10